MATLSSPARLFWYLANLGLGLIPSLMFFAWIERNCSLPFVGIELGWPWLDLASNSIPTLTTFNFALFLGFGAIHSLMAQQAPQRWFARLVPPQAIRSLYLVTTGLTALAVMGLWQNTGVVLWILDASPTISLILSLTVYWTLLLAACWIAARFDALHFVGLKQLLLSAREVDRAPGNPELITAGIFSRVRHPIYFLTLIAFVATPFMTLDRATFVASVTLYLFFAVPVEERKLIARFGDRYVEYQKRVPAVFPRLW